MRVLHVIPSLAGADGGPTHAMLMVEKALRAEGLDIEVATTSRLDPDSTASPDAPAPEGSTRLYFRRSFDRYKVSFSLLRWLAANAGNYDVVHVHAMFSFASTAAAWAARRAGTPYVLRPLGTLARYGMTRRRPMLKKLSFRLVEGPMLRGAAAVHFTSQAECDEARALGVPFNAVVIPLAVEQSPEAPSEPLRAAHPELLGRKWVVFLSRLDPKKNIEGLLGAVAQCASELPGMRWVIAGDGDPAYVAQLHALSSSLGLGEEVIWTGHLEGRLKAAALQHAEIFVLPSHSENFGIAAAEALQAGLPVVLGRGVALASMVEASGAGVACGLDPASIRNAMMEFLLDPQRRLLAAAKARELAHKEFSMVAMGKRLIELYYDIRHDAHGQRRPGNANA